MIKRARNHNIVIFLLCFGALTLYSSLSFAQEIVKKNAVQEKNGIVYICATKMPVTGIVQEYYDHGALYSEEYYVQGKKHGISRFYHETGEVDREATYNKGVLHGSAKIFYKDGHVHSEANFINGKKEGQARMYRKNGTVKSEVYFDNDTINIKKTIQMKKQSSF